jgi:hypothetical protein
MVETPAMREAFQIIGFSGLAVLVIGWLVISFSSPGPRRERLEWIAACGMYAALLSLFVHLSLRAWENGSTAALVAFGFLVLFFSSGFSVCLHHTLAALRGKTGKGPESATH